MVRDARIARIVEGTDEIMRLFIAREAVDRHFSIAFPIVDPRSSMGTRVRHLLKAAPFYLTWYPGTWISSMRSYAGFGRLEAHLEYLDRATRRLGRAIFHAMVRFGPGLEKRQMVLFRAVDIGAELYAMAASISRARMLAERGNAEAMELAEVFCRESRDRVEASFRALHGRHDGALYGLAQRVVRGDHAWIESGIVDPEPAGSALRPPAPAGTAGPPPPR